jgi:predicted DNA-binding WGR domain protein
MNQTYLELTNGISHKFYEVTVEGETLTVRYGRIGDTGQSSTKTFETSQIAQAEAQKKLAEKRKSGYVEAVQGEREKIVPPKTTRVPKLQIVGFTEVTEPITEAITKFGGQPVWLEEPRWPLCPQNGKQIPFLGQIRLEPEIFGDIEAKMAYIFFGSDDPSGDDTSWPTDHGDSAVVLQPGNRVFTGLYWQKNNGFPDCQIIATGPTAARYEARANSLGYEMIETECAAILELGADPAYIPHKTRDDWSDERQNAYNEQVMGHKIGGTGSLWDDPGIGEDLGILLLQMESTDSTDTPVPFGVYYGDGGCGWWFISRDGKTVTYQSMCH